MGKSAPSQQRTPRRAESPEPNERIPHAHIHPQTMMSQMLGSESFVISDAPASDNDDVNSLPSISSGVLDSDDEDDLSDAQREWEASLEQLQMLLTLVIVPFAGKFLGRKFAYWSRSPVSNSAATVY